MKQTQKLNTVSDVETVVEKAVAGESRKSRNIFAMASAGVSERTRMKTALLGDVRQKLAEIADEAKDSENLSAAASEKANTQAFRLYQARATGTISADELSGLLGDVFGYKLTSKGAPGKTPFGLGEVIRKRIVRNVAAIDFAEGRDGGAFFDPLEREEVKDVIEQVNNGNLSIWASYNKLAEMKSEATDRPHMAFDPRKIAGIVEKLNEEGARKHLLSNTSLQIAYGKLIETLNILGEVPADEAGEVAEAISEELTQPGENPVSQAA